MLKDHCYQNDLSFWVKVSIVVEFIYLGILLSFSFLSHFSPRLELPTMVKNALDHELQFCFLFILSHFFQRLELPIMVKCGAWSWVRILAPIFLFIIKPLFTTIETFNSGEKWRMVMSLNPNIYCFVFIYFKPLFNTVGISNCDEK